MQLGWCRKEEGHQKRGLGVLEIEYDIIIGMERRVEEKVKNIQNAKTD